MLSDGVTSFQAEVVLEKQEVHNPVPLIVGSSVGGLVLLALITFTLYKVRARLLTPSTCSHSSQHKTALTLEAGTRSRSVTACERASSTSDISRPHCPSIGSTAQLTDGCQTQGSGCASLWQAQRGQDEQEQQAGAVGFFKRQYKEMMAEANGQAAPGSGPSGPPRITTARLPGWMSGASSPFQKTGVGASAAGPGDSWPRGKTALPQGGAVSPVPLRLTRLQGLFEALKIANE
ncbi:hypothetical protein QTO34_013202 [Cnephaeus nilssonii]|uniref:Uncharacterized protein n=1 Tax=Cnephaeus nilssonii TaxID=3371016 RepID=A0AA40LSV4_CNENI|nr:hypothetical protein QTO34_013202 [Eptesicus nilssonii]